jgi:spermidine synthase
VDAASRKRWNAPPLVRLLVLLYFASGAVGLVDEVIFFKYLSLTFGATAHASSAVLVSFMGGLAIGATIAARLDRQVERPLAVYGALEIVVGIACAVSPWLFTGVGHFYASMAAGVPSLARLELLRGALAAGVVLLPTTAMGATLPLVARVAGAVEGGEGHVTALYGANTAGGALGSLLGGYAIIPSLGLAASLRAGAAVSIAVGVAAVVLSRRVARTPAAPAPAASTGQTPRGVVVAAAASGLLVFASEVVFVHLLALIDGTSVYVFGLVLAVFLVALSAGAAASRALARRAGRDALAASLVLSGLAVAATLPVWDRLPALFVLANPWAHDWVQRELVRGLVATIAIGLPATCMGMTFPLVLAALSPRGDRGAQTGRATAINTVASIGGSLAGGFLLLPLLGSQRALAAIAVGYALAALAVSTTGRRRIAGLAAATAVILAVVPRWDLARLASGTNIYFDRQPEQGEVVWINEDVHGGVVTVTRAGGITTLWTNGKYQGDTGWQMTPQRSFADVPAMFARHFDRALVVGLGTGVTLHETATYPFARIDLAELSPGIVKAARQFFGEVNGNVLDDPRVHVRLEDGRNLLAIGTDRYDVITVELTSIWFAGAANLYNREFYETAAKRLTPGGVLSQWVQMHHTTPREVASQLTTARTVFAHAAFFLRGQGVLVLSQEPLRAAPGADLGDLWLLDDTLDTFVDEVCREGGLTREQLVSTDDNLRLEYATPRNNIEFSDEWVKLGKMVAEGRSPEVAARLRAR